MTRLDRRRRALPVKLLEALTPEAGDLGRSGQEEEEVPKDNSSQTRGRTSWKCAESLRKEKQISI